jgi:alkanesulfonate monooxygenase SsuD/methylene tetrahydromethanopterin reductase-like flavin-dependent oxidoreductase (luciferase family)
MLAQAALQMRETDASTSLHIRAFMAACSFEATRPDAGDAATLKQFLNPGAQIYISAVPHRPVAESIESARAIRLAGLEPVPHIAARHFASLGDCAIALERLSGEAGVNTIMLIGGDADRPAGDVTSAQDIIDSGLLTKYGIGAIGLAGYPEAHPRIGGDELEAALVTKLASAQSQGLAVHEEDRLPLVRALDALAAIADALGGRRAPAIHRPGRRGRGAGRGRGLFPRPSLRPPARFAVSRFWRPSARRPSRIEIGTAVIDMRYENPLYMAEDAGAADLIAGGRLQLGISRGSPEQVIDGWRYFGYGPPRARATPTWAGATRRCSSTCCAARASRSQTRGRCSQIRRACCASSPFGGPARADLVGRRLQRHGGLGGEARVNLQSSTLKDDETGEPFHVQQANQIRAFRAAWKEAGHAREPRVSVSRSIFALMDDRDRAYFGRGREEEDQIGFIDEKTRGDLRSQLCRRARTSSSSSSRGRGHRRGRHAAADRPESTLGVAYNAHVIEAILTHVAPALGWR